MILIHDEERTFSKNIFNLDIFGLGTGIVSHVDGDNYIVRKVISNLEGLNEGEVIKLENTYCRYVLEKDEIVSVDEAGKKDEFKNHLVYQNMKLESYISAPIYVNKKIYGTINFSDQKIVNGTDDETNRTYIKHLARSVGRMLESREIKAESARVLNILNETGEIAGVGGWEMDVATGKLTWTDQTFKNS